MLVMWLVYVAVLLALSALLSAVVWHRRGGSISRGIYLGLTAPVVGVLMAFWLTPDGDDEQSEALARGQHRA